MFLHAESMSQILGLLQFGGNSFLVMMNIPSGSRSFPNVGDEEVGNHFEPYKKCVQVMEFSFKIK